MTYYFASSELEAFGFSGSTTTTTTAGRFDPLYCRSAILLEGEDSLVALMPNAVSEVWIHFDMHNASSVGTGNLLTISNSLSQTLFRIRFSSSPGQLIADYYDTAGVAQSIYASINLPPIELTTVDVHVTANGVSSSHVALYLGGLKVGYFTGVSERFTNIFRIQWGCPNLQTMALSQIIVADTPTTGRKLAVRPIIANGTYTAWTGDYTDINENGLNDATMIVTDTAGALATYDVSQLTGIPSTTNVEAVIISLRAQKTATSPQNLQGVLRVSGLDYTSDNFTNLDEAQTGQCAAWTVNPATGVKWTYAEANDATLEVGVKSVA